jgi:serine/threonine protein kinase
LIDLKSIFIRHDPNHHDVEYLAPESTNDSYVYTRERDIWAVGMMIHNIIHGKYF